MKNSKKEILSLLLAATMLLSTSGCSKKADCNINTSHAHKYTNDEGYTKYLISENIKYKNYNRNNDYIELNEKDIELFKFLKDNNVLRIEDNIDKIKELKEKYSKYDHVEYEYKYRTTSFIYTGKTMVPVHHTHYSWTLDNSDNRLTGNKRYCHYTFYKVNVLKDDKGKYVIIPSEYNDEILDDDPNYPYIKQDFCVVYDKVNNKVYNDVEMDLNKLKTLKEKYPDEFTNEIKTLRYK